MKVYELKNALSLAKDDWTVEAHLSLRDADDEMKGNIIIGKDDKSEWFVAVEEKEKEDAT
jgi:hypothetical protein